MTLCPEGQNEPASRRLPGTGYRAGVVLVLLALAGCDSSERIDTVYGQRSGREGAASVNGTSVFARMFEASGARVSTWSRMSPGLNDYGVIVWAPDDFDPPTWKQRQFIRQWFFQGEGRTLIYIGRDYDAAPTYWQKMKQTAPPTEVGEIDRRLAGTRADYDAARSGIPEKQFCEWFTVRRDGVPRDVRSLWGPLSEGIDASQVEIELRARFDRPTPADVQQAADDEDHNDAAIFDPWQADPWADDEFDPSEIIPSQIEVLLGSRDDPLVTRVSDESFRADNQVIVVTNGSFLLNLPLVNHEHRKLAGRLIDATGDPEKVAFLESGPYGPPILDDEPGTGMPTGLEVLIVWPIGCILMHFAVAGILYCYAGYPIFGRPQELPPDSTADFRKHIDAVGELLHRTDDPGYAVERIKQYQQTVRGETTSQRGGRFRPSSGKKAAKSDAATSGAAKSDNITEPGV